MLIYILGFSIGLISAIPIGPVNLLAITQVLRRDFLHGFMVGLTGALLDGLFCYLAFYGVSLITPSLSDVSPLLKIVTSALLTSIGIRLLLKARSFHEDKQSESSMSTLHRPIITTVVLYLVNPAVYAFWLIIAGTAGANNWLSDTKLSHVIFAVFVMLGALSWFSLLTIHVARYHHQFKLSTIQKSFTVIAILLFLMALYTLGTMIF